MQLSCLRNGNGCVQLAAFFLFIACPNRADAQTDVSHPWLATAPGEFIRLIDNGNVQILVDDERVQKARKSALTVFRFDIQNEFKYRHQMLGYDEKLQAWQAKIVAWMDQPKFKLEHNIFFRSTFSPTLPWESKLLRHEFDHVAISTDPRLLKIIKRTLQQRHQWIATWQQASAPTDADIRKNIVDTFQEEVKALEKLVQSQYDYLDQESNQGVLAIKARTDFFKGLYTLDGLGRCHYQLDKSMQDFVKEKLSSPANDKEVEGHYLFLAP